MAVITYKGPQTIIVRVNRAGVMCLLAHLIVLQKVGQWNKQATPDYSGSANTTDTAQ